ncbi:L259 protein, partial [Acromyrmex insinuator]
KVPLKKESRPKLYKTVYKTFSLSYFIIGICSLHVGTRIRIACSSLLYRKLLRFNTAAMNQTGTGQIMNLLSNDVIRFDQLSMYLNYMDHVFYDNPLFRTIMWQKIGISNFISIGGIHNRYPQEIVVKMYAWEKPFSQIVSVIRKLEIKQIKFSSYVRAAYLAIIAFTERLTVYFTLITFILMENVANVCTLTKDFRQFFPQEDMTMVGDRGVSLSSGQKVRINVARAVYKQADIYLLDDPLSAVDTSVARHLYGECITEYLHGKTRILVIYQLQFLKRVDHIVVSDRIKKFLILKVCFQSYYYYFAIVQYSNTDDSDYIVENCPEVKMTTHGQVVGRVHKEYLHNDGNNFTLSVLLIIFIISQVAIIGNDYWLLYWTTLEDVRRIENTSDVKQFATIVFLVFMLNPDSLLSDYSRVNNFLETREVDDQEISERLKRLTEIWDKFHNHIKVLATLELPIDKWNAVLIVANKLDYHTIVSTHCAKNSRHILLLAQVFDANRKTKVLVNKLYLSDKSVNVLVSGISQNKTYDEFLILNKHESKKIFSGVDYAGPIQIREGRRRGRISLSKGYIALFVCFHTKAVHLEAVTKLTTEAFLTALWKFTARRGLCTTLYLDNATNFVGAARELTEPYQFIEEFNELQNRHSGTWYLFLTCAIAFAVVADLIMCLFLVCICFSLNLNVSIESGWKIEVVGGTGAGKSSLISALFCLFYEGLEDEVKINDQGTSTIGLSELPCKISIILDETTANIDSQ